MDRAIEEKLEIIAKASESGEIEWSVDAENKGIYIRNIKFGSKIFATWDAIEKNSIDTIINQTVEGRDVDHITRVTGYFSTTSNWNKGKIAELNDRFRSKDLAAN